MKKIIITIEYLATAFRAGGQSANGRLGTYSGTEKQSLQYYPKENLRALLDELESQLSIPEHLITMDTNEDELQSTITIDSTSLKLGDDQINIIKNFKSKVEEEKEITSVNLDIIGYNFYHVEILNKLSD